MGSTPAGCTRDASRDPARKGFRPNMKLASFEAIVQALNSAAAVGRMDGADPGAPPPAGYTWEFISSNALNMGSRSMTSLAEARKALPRFWATEGDFHTDAAAPELQGEMGEIGVACY